MPLAKYISSIDDSKRQFIAGTLSAIIPSSILSVLALYPDVFSTAGRLACLTITVMSQIAGVGLLEGSREYSEKHKSSEQ